MLHVTLGSYNVGGTHPRVERRGWGFRQPRVLEAVDEVGPAIMAFQEIPRHGSKPLAAAMAARGYALASIAPDATRLPQAIFFRSPSLRFRDSGRDALYAELVDGSKRMRSPRSVQWADFDARGGTRLRVCNLHLIGSGFKRAATDYVLDREAFRKAFLLGDFNTVPREHVHRQLVEGGWQDAAEGSMHRDPGPTIHRFGKARRRRIDWILAPSGWATLGYRVSRRADVEDEPSDHHPVFAHVAREVEEPGRALGVLQPWRHAQPGRGADTLK